VPDPDTVLDEVSTFVQLAEAGAYMGGDRRVHHTERSKWRHTFRRADYGWTRRGYGQVAEKETPLAVPLARLLTTPDMWRTFAESYLEALDAAGRADPERPRTSGVRRMAAAIGVGAPGGQTESGCDCDCDCGSA
jgi:hypothetical protein